MFALIILAIIILIVIAARAGAGNTNSEKDNTPTAKTTRCPNCGEYKLAHKMCSCGEYNGKQIVEK